MPSFIINGSTVDPNISDDTPLLWVLRDVLGLTGTKFGCGAGLCGACTVHINGSPQRACQQMVGDLEGKSVTTIEGVSGRVYSAVHEAWLELDVVECGYCQPGQIMQAIGLLNENPRPNDAEIDAAMDGNICRCCTYLKIKRAVMNASDILEAGYGRR